MNYEPLTMNYSVKRGFEKQKIHLAGRHRQILRDKYNQPPPGINKTIYFSVVEVITQPGAEKLQEGKIYFELVGFCLRHIITRLAKEINEPSMTLATFKRQVFEPGYLSATVKKEYWQCV